MSKKNSFLNMIKENKKLMYAVNIFIILVVISLILKLDTKKITNDIMDNQQLVPQNTISEVDNYVYTLERKVEKILGEIEGIKNVSVMLYTKNTPKLEPIYDENSSTETNVEVGSDGIKREVKRETKDNNVVTSNNRVAEKYYEYPEITGVLVVVDYTGNKDIYSILMNSVKTLFNIKLNNIEVILSLD